MAEVKAEWEDIIVKLPVNNDETMMEILDNLSEEGWELTTIPFFDDKYFDSFVASLRRKIT